MTERSVTPRSRSRRFAASSEYARDPLYRQTDPADIPQGLPGPAQKTRSSTPAVRFASFHVHKAA